jgi:integrase/recombinase XerD
MNTHFETILMEYVNWLDTLGYSDSLLRTCKGRIFIFFTWLESKHIQNINQLTNKDIEGFCRHTETRPNKIFKGRLLSAMHINWYFLAINKLLEFLYQYGMTNLPSPINYRIKANPQERILSLDILTQEEIKTLYNCIPNTYLNLPFEERPAKQHELKLIFALCYGCGLRRSEAYNIRIQDVDFDKKTVFVKQGKNYKDRIIPMNAGVYAALQDYVYNFRHKLKLKHNRLFICGNKQTLGAKLKYLQNFCDDQNIKAKRLSLHVLRHSIATHLLQNGMSIENIALFLGHSSLNATQLYTHLV